MRRFLFVLSWLFLMGTLSPNLSAQILEVRITVDGMT